jgi:hypothetical protein
MAGILILIPHFQYSSPSSKYIEHNVLRIWIWISYQHPEDKDRDGLLNVVFLIVQPLDPAESPRELYYI